MDRLVQCDTAILDCQVQFCKNPVMDNRKSSNPTGLTPRGAETRRRILDCTVQLMYQKGVESTSLDDVRAASGASKSQLYHYFSDKSALVCAVIEAQTENVLHAQRPELEETDSLPAFLRWRDKVLALYRQNAVNGGCPLGSLANELANQSEPARQLLVEGFRSWETQLRDAFVRMQERGLLLPTASPSDLATAVLSATQGGLLLAKTMRSERPLVLALDMATRHVEQAMVARA